MPENGSFEPRNRPYVVLEEVPVKPVVQALLAAAGVELDEGEWVLVDAAASGMHPSSVVYREVMRVPSRNAAHALTQAGRNYQVGVTPPLVAVTERMFRPRTVSVEEGDRRVSVA